jgi:hypothetical protein
VSEACEMLAPLSYQGNAEKRKPPGKLKPYHWNLIHQIAFDNVKIYHRKEVVMAYPCFSKPFEIYTDASTLQLGAVITRENRPIAFFSQNSLARNVNTPLPN